MRATIMAKQDEPQELALLSEPSLEDAKNNIIDVSNLLWQTKDEGLIPLKMMADSHLRNAALMLIGMSHQAYNAPDSLKIRWLTALRLEWEKRVRERHATKVG